MCGPFTGDRTALVTPADMVPPRGWFVALWLDAEPVVGGGVRTLAGGVGEVKRIWVAPELARRAAGRDRIGCTQSWPRAVAAGHRSALAAAVRGGWLRDSERVRDAREEKVLSDAPM